MHIDLEQLIAVLPIISLTTFSVIVMLCAAFYRRHALIAGLTFFGIVFSLACVYLQSGSSAVAVTSLLMIDRFSCFFTALILVTTAVITLFCYTYFKAREGLQEELYILLLTATVGAVVLVSSAHFASFFLGLEILSVSLFAMVAYPVTSLTHSDHSASTPLEAGIKYLILSGISSAMLALGMAFIFAATGTMDIVAIGKSLSVVNHGYYVIAGVAMMISGIGFKLSLVPFHMWTPDVYQGAPAPVTAFLATISKSAMLALVLRGFILLEGFRYDAIVRGVSIIAIASMLGGNLLALKQNNIKRLLAYSSISHSGYILVAFLSVMSAVSDTAHPDQIAMEAVTYYIVTYVLTTLTAFGVISVLSSANLNLKETRDIDHFDDFQGLYWRRPVVASVFTLALLSSAGIPLTIGFIGKFYIFAAGVSSALWTLLAVLIVGSGIGLFYYLRLILALFKTDSAEDSVQKAIYAVSANDTIALPLGSRWLITALGGLILLLGIYPTPLIAVIRGMVQSLYP